MQGLEGRRSLFLLVSALILPSLAVVAFGLGMIAQERELSASRAEEARRRAVSDLGQGILARLERIKTQEISASPDIDAPPAGRSDAAVVFVGWEEQGRLILPWDRDPGAARFRAEVAEADYARKIEAADASPVDAIPIYGAALKSSQNDSQVAHAQFKLAGIATNASPASGRGPPVPRTVVAAVPRRGRPGMPFAFYAAHRLLQAPQDVAGRLAPDLDAAAGFALQAFTIPPGNRR